MSRLLTDKSLDTFCMTGAFADGPAWLESGRHSILAALSPLGGPVMHTPDGAVLMVGATQVVPLQTGITI